MDTKAYQAMTDQDIKDDLQRRVTASLHAKREKAIADATTTKAGGGEETSSSTAAETKVEEVRRFH